MSDDIDWAALSSYLAGHASADAVREVERWIAAEPSRAALIEELRAIWRASGVVGPRYDVERALRQARTIRAAARLAGAEAQESPRLRISSGVSAPTFGHASRGARRPRIPTDHRPVHRHRRSVIRTAAIAAVMVLALGSWIVVQWPRMTRSHARSALGTRMREIATTRGQRDTLTLPDGSRVWLNVASRLRIPANFGTHARDVYLEGEGYFQVMHDPSTPFLVHTPGAVTEDIGTEFVVRAYPGDSTSTVAVVSGRVAFRLERPGAGRGIGLQRGQRANLDPSGLLTVSMDSNFAAIGSWRVGRLEFHKTELWRVIRELERWYDVKITLDDSALASVPVTTTLTTNRIDDVLDVLSDALDVHHVRRGRVIRLVSGARSP